MYKVTINNIGFEHDVEGDAYVYLTNDQVNKILQAFVRDDVLDVVKEPNQAFTTDILYGDDCRLRMVNVNPLEGEVLDIYKTYWHNQS